MMRLVALSLLALLALALPASAGPQECKPVEAWLGLLQSEGVTVRVIQDKDTVEKAAEFYAIQPPEGPTPPAELLLVAEKDGQVAFLLTKGTDVCWSLMVPAAATEAVKEKILGERGS